MKTTIKNLLNNNAPEAKEFQFTNDCIGSAKNIYNQCFAIFKDVQMAEDVCQDVLIELINSEHKFNGKASFKTWIFSVTRNRCIDQVRKNKLRQTVSIYVDNSDSLLDAIIVIANSDKLPDEKYQNKELKNAELSAIDALPPKQREAFCLQYYEEKTYKQIADKMSNSVSAVKALLMKANINLRAKLEIFN